MEKIFEGLKKRHSYFAKKEKNVSEKNKISDMKEMVQNEMKALMTAEIRLEYQSLV